MTDVTEEYFRALGWKRKINTKDSYCTAPITNPEAGPDNDERLYWSAYPNITQNYPDFKKWVLEKMEGEEAELRVIHGGVKWVVPMDEFTYSELTFESTVHNGNEILEAAVIAATRYWREKNDS